MKEELYRNDHHYFITHGLQKGKYQSKAGIDFTHCEKGRCANCSEIQRKQCEKEVS